MNPITVFLPIFVLLTAVSFFDGRVPDEWVFWAAVAVTLGFISIVGIVLRIIRETRIQAIMRAYPELFEDDEREEDLKARYQEYTALLAESKKHSDSAEVNASLLLTKLADLMQSNNLEDRRN